MQINQDPYFKNLIEKQYFLYHAWARESKKWFLEIGLFESVSVESFDHGISDAKRDRKAKFYAYYQAGVLMRIASFGENKKTESEVR